jgi:2-hydroxy-6-oxonona-2,4-dienedioate hydrolase
MANTIWQDLDNVSFRVRFIDAKGVRTRVLETGERGMPVLFLLPGQTGHLEAYVRNVGPLGEHFHTFAIDPLGCGFTDKPKTPYLIRDYVDHLRDVMDAEGIEKAHFSGESNGGWTALRLATVYPERADKLVLNTCGGYNWDEDLFKRIRALTIPAVMNGNRDEVRARLEWLMEDKSLVTEELVEVRMRIYSMPEFQQNVERMLDVQVPEIRKDIRITDDELRNTNHESLVLWTVHDPTAPTTVADKMAELLPHSKKVILEGAGHWPQWEIPDEFNDVHVRFLQGRL